jgi:hypothetical protein
MEVLVALSVVGALVLVVPLLVLGALLKLATAVILLPFKIIGALFKGVFGILGGLLGLVFGGLGLLVGLLVMVGVCVILPLAPLLLLGLIVWVALKAASPAPGAA